MGNATKNFTTMGGILQFKDDECLILTTLAETDDEIDEVRARDALERAKRRLQNAEARMDAKRAEAAIARAEARLKARLSGEKSFKM
jgi:F-type H+-transporting ATPase subunit epsilon